MITRVEPFSNGIPWMLTLVHCTGHAVPYQNWNYVAETNL